MMSMTETAEHLDLQLDLRVDASPGSGVFKAIIELREIDLLVEATALDVSDAMRTAAERCADRLCELGYAVTPADVLAALVDTREPWLQVPRGEPIWN
jgi:hypothetical protein